MDDEEMYHRMVKIGHTHHQPETQDTLIKSLSPYYDKKWIQKNGDVFKTYIFGHKNIPGKYEYIYTYTHLKYIHIYRW